MSQFDSGPHDWARFQTFTSNNTTGVFFHQLPPIELNIAALTPPKKERKMPETVRGGAPTKTLYADYVLAANGYRGQVRYGDAERKSEAMVLWEGEVIEVAETEDYKAKEKALKQAEAALSKALKRLFRD